MIDLCEVIDLQKVHSHFLKRKARLYSYVDPKGDQKLFAYQANDPLGVQGQFRESFEANEHRSDAKLLMVKRGTCFSSKPHAYRTCLPWTSTVRVEREESSSCRSRKIQLSIGHR